MLGEPSRMPESIWIAAVRAAGVFHLVTVALAHVTPIPRDWDQNLARLPDVHRRFAVAQNVFIGATMVFAGIVSIALAPALVMGTPVARAVCLGIALWWGARVVVLQWLRVWPQLTSPWLRLGFAALHLECIAFALGYGWLAVR